MLLYKRDHHSEHNGAHVIVKNYISCHREHSLNWFLKSSTFCNITFGCCIKHPWPKIGLSQKLIFERIVHQSKRNACKMGGPDTADLCAVDLDHAPSNLRTNHTFKVLLHQFKTPSVYLSVRDKTCLGTSIPFLGTIYIP